MVITQITQGHGSAMSIGSFNSSQCKGTLVRDPGPRGPGRHGVSCRQLSPIAALALVGAEIRGALSAWSICLYRY